MSLATRCVSCGTVFRVVQDQLKVSEGWVRCGRCEHVFNALDSLFDLERETPPPWPPPPPAPARSSGHGTLAALPREDDAVVVDEDERDADADVDVGADHGSAAPVSSARLLGVPSAAEAPAAESPAPAAERPRRIFPWSRPGALDPIPPAPSPADDQAHAPTQILLPPHEVPSEITTEMLAEGMPPADVSASEIDSQAEELKAEAAPTPEFVRRAQDAERWNRPRTRIGLSLLGGLLALVLAVQVAVHQRDWIAAHAPLAEPALRALCQLFGCQLDALKRIDSFAVESSGLTRLDGPGNLHRLSLALRNHASVALEVPAVELTLTDSRGQVVARKVLMPADFGVAQTTLAQGHELPLQATLDIGERRVFGYSIEIFYP